MGALLSGGGVPRRVVGLYLTEDVVPLIGAALFAKYDDVFARDDLFARSAPSAGERGAVFDAPRIGGTAASFFRTWELRS